MGALKALYIIPLVGISLAATAKTSLDYRYPAQLEAADTLKGKVMKISVKKEKSDSVKNTITIVSNNDTPVTGTTVKYLVDGKVETICVVDGNMPGSSIEGNNVVIISKNGSDATMETNVNVSSLNGQVVSISSSVKKNGTIAVKYIVDGKETDEISSIDSSDIESMSILKDEKSLKKFKAKGKDAVIIITTRK